LYEVVARLKQKQYPEASRYSQVQPKSASNGHGRIEG
jgi:hypothetical protein